MGIIDATKIMLFTGNNELKNKEFKEMC